jgi:multidrug efflux pump subunit AcrA (membrane-fusion protein)
MFSAPQVEGIQSIHKVRAGRFAAALALLILFTLAGGALALVEVPWYQSVPGMGKVTVFSAMDRSQQVDAQISGRIQRWDVSEGQTVRQGQRLGLLVDIDSKFLDPLLVQRTQQMVEAYERKRELTQLRMATLQQQRQAILQARAAALPAAEQRLAQSRQRQQQNQQTLRLAQQNLQTDRLQYERLRSLEEQGLRSRRDYELAQQAWVRSQTELERTELSLGVARRDIDIASLELQRLGSNFENDLAKIQESMLKTQEGLAEVDAVLAKSRSELSGVRQRRQQQIITAPGDGRVVRLLRLGRGETVKAGDALCTLMPAVEDPAVEIFITDFNAPLVHPNQRVRLMFDGFPAIPFTAFPWAEVGTFGGRVAVVDAVDDGTGRYRVLVVPSEDKGEIDWPQAQEGGTSRYPLRPGTQAQGWIMMDKPVPLYWELWRRLNGFPPVPLGSDKGSDTGGKGEKDYQPKPVLKR